MSESGTYLLKITKEGSVRTLQVTHKLRSPAGTADHHPMALAVRAGGRIPHASAFMPFS